MGLRGAISMKRSFCALWMAAAACIVAPVFLLDAALILLPLGSGAVVGWLLQPFAIGRHSNRAIAAATGSVCAVLALPVGLLGFGLVIDPLEVFGDPGGSLGTIFSLSWSALRYLWWWILPMGALAGMTLQCGWLAAEERRAVTRKDASETAGG